MSVETTTRKTTQSMTAAIIEYTFAFRALISAPSDIKCKRTVTATSVDTDMEYVTEIPAPSDATDVLKYMVDVNDDGVGGTVTVMWPSTGCTITIYRETTDTQASAYEDYNQFPADTVETDFDKRTMISQETKEEIDRTVKFAITSAVTSGTLPSGQSNTYLGWDTAGTSLENKTLVTDGTILVKATEGEAVAGSDDNAYMTPLKTKQAVRTLGTINVTTHATIVSMDAVAATVANLLVTTTATISAGVVTTLTVTTINISSGTIAGAVTGATQTKDDNSTKLATTAYTDTAVSSAATLQAWASITFSEATPTLQKSYNVSAVSTVATGRLTVTWNTAFADTNYCVVANARELNSTNIICCNIAEIATGSVIIETALVGGALYDPLAVYVMAIGDQ